MRRTSRFSIATQSSTTPRGASKKYPQLAQSQVLCALAARSSRSWNEHRRKKLVQETQHRIFCPRFVVQIQNFQVPLFVSASWHNFLFDSLLLLLLQPRTYTIAKSGLCYKDAEDQGEHYLYLTCAGIDFSPFYIQDEPCWLCGNHHHPELSLFIAPPSAWRGLLNLTILEGEVTSSCSPCETRAHVSIA